MENIVIIGYVGGAINIISILPQLFTILYHKSAKDISLTSYGLFILSQCCWITYGILEPAFVVVISNAVCMFISILIIMSALYYRKVDNQQVFHV